MKRQTKTSKRKSYILLGIFLAAWCTITILLNIEHRKDIRVLSAMHDLSLTATEMSDAIYSSHVTGLTHLHGQETNQYEAVLEDLSNTKEKLNSLWPNTPDELVSGIDELILAYYELKDNPGSLEANKHFSNANVFLFDMSYHEYTIARRDMRHQNLPLFLILAVAILFFLRFTDSWSININWSGLLQTKKVSG